MKKKITMSIIKCKRCLMDSTIKEFKIVKDNICNYCDEWDQKIKFYSYTNEEVKNNLESLKSQIQSSKINGSYDCVIGLSGGIDSSYLTYLAWILKLKPLIIHMDNGWNSKVSNSNISRILDKTGFDYKTLIVNWNEFKSLQISFLKSGVPDIELLTDHAIFSYLFKCAIENNIKYILSGVNFRTEHGTVGSWGWRKDDFNHIYKIDKKFQNTQLKTYPKMTILQKLIYTKILKKVKIIQPLDLINYNSTEAKKIIQKEFEWEDYGGKHYESFFTMFFQGYILPKKFNIDKRKLHYSCLIRNKEITLEQANNLIKLNPINLQNIRDYINFFKKKLSLSDYEYEQIINSAPKKHEDYDYDIYNNYIFKFLNNTIFKYIK